MADLKSALSYNLIGEEAQVRYKTFIAKGSVLTFGIVGDTPYTEIVRVYFLDKEQKLIDFYNLAAGVLSRKISLSSEKDVYYVYHSSPVLVQLNIGDSLLPYKPYIPITWQVQTEVAAVQTEVAAVQTEVADLHISNLIGSDRSKFYPVEMPSGASLRIMLDPDELGDGTFQLLVFDENKTRLDFYSITASNNPRIADTSAISDKIKYLSYNFTKDTQAEVTMLNAEYKNIVFFGNPVFYKKSIEELQDNKPSELQDKIINENLDLTMLTVTNDFEYGTLTRGEEIDSTVRMRTKNYYPTNGKYSIYVLDDSFYYEVDYFDENKGWASRIESYRNNSDTFDVSTSATQKYFRLLIRKKNNGVISFTDIAGVQLGLMYPKADPGYTGLIRLKVMSNNVGHFNYGYSGGYQEDDVDDALMLWKTMLAKHEPDIILTQEYQVKFDKNDKYSADADLYRPLFPYQNWRGVGCIWSKFPFIQTWSVDLTVTVEDQTNSRSCACGLIRLGGVDVVLCATHLAPGYQAIHEQIREAQRDKLIEALTEYDRVIIGGDFNSNVNEFYAGFTEAGYFVCNHGYWGTITTLPRESVDNIIIKGFVASSTSSSEADKCTSDHYPLVAGVRAV